MGLRNGDLRDLVYDIFEIDSFKSKMGSDEEIITLSFSVKDKLVAEDVMNFIEKGYGFVLDADSTPGEQSDGTYKVFVEIERDKRAPEQIMELAYGVTKLTGIDDWKFKYYKNKDFVELTTENLKSKVPSSSKIYEQSMNKFRTNEMKQFFSKTLMDELVLENNKITILKPFDVKVQFELVTEGDDKLIEGMEDIQVDDNATAEIFWLTKVMGDYNIQKFGDNYLFTNESRSMVLRRL